VTRLYNENCVPIPYALRTAVGANSQSVTLLKDLGTQTAASFRLHVAWQPEPSVSPVPATLVDPDPDDLVPATALQWCLGTRTTPQLPAGQLWCLTDQATTIVGGGRMQVTEDLFGSGDPLYARPR
jgi:hypothetical protein